MSQATAESIAVASWERKKRAPLYPYRCPKCGFWHMTKQVQSTLDYGQTKGGLRG